MVGTKGRVNEKFTVKSTWYILRNRSPSSDDFKKPWVTEIPFKISSFGCRISYVRETLEHLFLLGETTTFIWNYYARAIGLLGPWVYVKQTMKKW
ncbi:hypothetical protein H5410_001437 [Solanum commersonii]|uniref:Uncharacterized protein n=1 Tax=Solanum commersonii TaxID=4109 RepID=A0A9J6AZ12_SOLCO|nr:hypothetical protein H5410_001437 [Solanum commersonii]